MKAKILKVIQRVLGDHVVIKNPDEPAFLTLTLTLNVAHHKALTLAEQEQINAQLFEAGVPYVLGSLQGRSPDQRVTVAVRRLTFRLIYPKKGSWSGAPVDEAPLRVRVGEAEAVAEKARGIWFGYIDIEGHSEGYWLLPRAVEDAP